MTSGGSTWTRRPRSWIRARRGAQSSTTTGVTTTTPAALGSGHLGHRTMVVLEIEATDSQRDGTCIPQSLSTYLRQVVNDREPHVWLGLGETDSGAHLTLVEAALLAEVLGDVVERGRGTT